MSAQSLSIEGYAISVIRRINSINLTNEQAILKVVSQYNRSIQHQFKLNIPEAGEV